MPEYSPMKDPRGYPTYEQVLMAMEHAPAKIVSVLIMWLFDSGHRISEALSVDPKDIDWKRNAVLFRAGKKRTVEYREVSISQKVADEVLNILSTPEWKKASAENKKVVGGDRVFPFSRYRAYAWIRQAFENAGIYTIGDSRITQHIHPHPHHLRHGLAMYWVKTKGMDIVGLQKLLGHSQLGTTLHYLNYSLGDIAEAKEKLGLWGKSSK